MGSITCTDTVMAAHLRGLRTTTQADVDEVAAVTVAESVSPRDRWASQQAHSAAAPAAH